MLNLGSFGQINFELIFVYPGLIRLLHSFFQVLYFLQKKLLFLHQEFYFFELFSSLRQILLFIFAVSLLSELKAFDRTIRTNCHNLWLSSLPEIKLKKASQFASQSQFKRYFACIFISKLDLTVFATYYQGFWALPSFHLALK
jgi:hypothetical protein